MSRYDITVVIPVYNYADRIVATLDSVVSQSHPPREIIVVNDGSTDATAEQLAGYCHSHPDVPLKVITQANAGPSAARNAGLEQATSPYTLLLDADDALAEGALEAFSNTLENQGGPDLVIAGAWAEHESRGERHYRPPPVLSNSPETNFAGFCEGKVLMSHGRFVARTRLLQDIRYPEAIRGAEDQVVYGLLLANSRAVSLPQATVVIHHHAGSLRHDALAVLSDGEKVVDALFSHPLLPAGFARYRKRYAVRRLLSMFRTCYREGCQQEARALFEKAFALSPWVLFRWSYSRKYARLRLAMGNRRPFNH